MTFYCSDFTDVGVWIHSNAAFLKMSLLMWEGDKKAHRFRGDLVIITACFYFCSKMEILTIAQYK
jgi:hypothetical protein